MKNNRFVVDQLNVNEQLLNPVIEQLTTHKSVRSFKPNEALSDDVFNILVAAAQSAPTSSNFQSWSMIIIEDQERKQKLMELSGQQAFIGEASALIVFCADASRHKYITENQGYTFNSNYFELLLMSSMDSILAAQNTATAAESLGLGTCMVGGIRNHAREVAKLLQLPKLCYATVGLAIGYPTKEDKVKPRLPQKVVVHRETYSTEHLDEGIKAYDELMAKTSIYDGRRLTIPGVTPSPDNGHYGWMEHTARRMTQGNEARKDLAPFLTEHGFTLK